MTRHLLVAVATALFAGSLIGQTASFMPSEETAPVSYRIDPRALAAFRAEEERSLELHRANPNAPKRPALAKTGGWGFVVGSTRTWKSVSLSNGTYFNVASTCRGVGTNCYVFVEDASWGARVNQAAVDSVLIAFDSRTPANAAKGIYQINTETFGNPPDIDADPKVIILILDIQDGYSGSGGYVAGYFSSVNEFSTASQPNSNAAEIYYLDCNPATLTTASGIADGMSTTSHEFQHMIHFNYDVSEISFVNEACSLVAEVVCGYPIYSQSGFAGEPNHYLFDWRRDDHVAVLRDYSRAARFGAFLRDQYGAGVFKPLVASAATGASGITDGIAAVTTPVQFTTVLQNFLIANTLNDRTVSTSYGYLYPGLAPVSATNNINPNVASTNGTVQAYAADYIAYTAGTDLSATFTVPVGSSLVIKAVEFGATPRVLSVTPGTPFTEPAFGTTYTKVVFVVMNPDGVNPKNYTYQSTGTLQSIVQKWDVQEPIGLLNYAANDTVCVTFDAVSGARLDSVKVALRRAGSVVGGIYAFDSVTAPLGPKLASITASTTFDTPLTGAAGQFPYPIPYPNYCTIDVRSENISGNQALSVAFPLVYNVSNQQVPGFVVTKAPKVSPSHNYFYLAERATPAWYTITNSTNDSMYVFPWRAYYSFEATGVEKELVVMGPRAFTLGQNYPNPFNPTTILEFSLPEKGGARLSVFNLVGEEVAVLFSGEATAGRIYQASFDAPHLPSGMYVARLQWGAAQLVRKMVLMR